MQTSVMAIDRPVHHAIYLPAIGTLADPSALLEIAQAADENGWDGMFLWDHVQFGDDGPLPTLDPWTLFGAIASQTRHLRFGPMVTPLPSRRVSQVARSATTLDHLSKGRLTLGFGLGGDTRRELSAFSEPLLPRVRGQILDESLQALVALWDEKPATIAGQYVSINKAHTEPRPVQRPRIPIWLASVGWAPRPVRRAAQFDGVIPTDISPDDLRRIVDEVISIRGSLDDFDVAIPVTPRLRLRDYADCGVNWAMHAFWLSHKPSQVMRIVSRAPRID